MMRQALISVCHQLNTIDIIPVLLKGAISLVMKERPDSFDRIMSDLDLFIPDGRSQEAYDYLKKIRYTPIHPPESRNNCKPAHHEISLQHSDFPVAIELHSRIVSSKQFNDMSDWLNDAEIIIYNGAKIKLPSPTFRVLHNVIHHNIHHKCFSTNNLDIRRLQEFVHIYIDRPKEVRYQELSNYFQEKKIYSAWLTYCLSGKRLFDCPLPCAVPKLSYAGYKDLQIRLHTRFPFLLYSEYWLRRASRLPTRLLTPSWYPMKFRSLINGQKI